MKHAEEAAAMLNYYDLTQSLRAAAELAGVSHVTVARYVDLRDRGELPGDPRPPRARVVDDYLDKIEEWVDASQARIRADVCHRKLRAMGYAGSERTTRRAVAEAKARYRAGHRRVHRPWITEPGMWFQWDFGHGPRIGDRETLLFCAWLAWSRYRVVFPIWDKTLPTVIGAIDRTLRAFGACPTYALTDNEKTVTVQHIARIAVRHPEVVAAGAHYGLTIMTCHPADAPSKGGVEATVRTAKADLVPTHTNLLPAYSSFAELEGAAAAFCDEVNSRPHRVTRRAPTEMLVEERHHMHRLPVESYTAAFGVTRAVPPNTPMVSFDTGQYSVPHELCGQQVWVRRHGDDVVFVAVDRDGAKEVARHLETTPGSPRVDDAHFPPRTEDPLHRKAVAQNDDEAAFLQIGEGARRWLTEAAEAGTNRVRAKMAVAVSLAKLHPVGHVDWALGHCAVMGRFREGDVESVLAHRAGGAGDQALTASDTHSLSDGAAAWDEFGR